MVEYNKDTGFSFENKLAKAVYDGAVALAREWAAARDPGIDRIRRVFDTAFQETDRSAAILVFALAEDMMVEGLKLNLNNNIKGGWSSVTEPTGLLGTAANRITLLHMLNWVRPETANDLMTLKAIRNRFAHHAELDGFSDQKIRSWIANLLRVEGPVQNQLQEKLKDRSFTPREQYLMRACSTVTRLASDLIVGPVSRKSNVDPNDVEGRGDGDLLPRLRDVHRVLGEVILRVVESPSSPLSPVS